jgi:8-oxo-dGTP diphosphatase
MTTSDRPLVGICVLILKDGKILLGKRRGSHGAGQYAAPGGHLEHLESFYQCATREVLEETGMQIGPLRFLRVLNATQYAPKHYVDIAFVAAWESGEPEVREPDKVESWGWYSPDDLPSPLFAMLPSAIDAFRGRPGQRVYDGEGLEARIEASLEAARTSMAASMQRQQRVLLTKHRDGSDCTCDPRCDCHPPERREDTAEIQKRGSFHLRTCPAFVSDQTPGDAEDLA